MTVVGLKLGREAAEPLAEALRKAGFSVDGGEPEVEVRDAAPPSADDASDALRRCLEGGRLLVCGTFGPLSAALHLGPAGDPVRGHAGAFRSGLPHLTDVEATPVTGVGYALYRIGPACVAVGGPRGRGWVAYLGDAAPDPALATACVRWLEKTRHQDRFGPPIPPGGAPEEPQGP